MTCRALGFWLLVLAPALAAAGAPPADTSPVAAPPAATTAPPVATPTTAAPPVAAPLAATAAPSVAAPATAVPLAATTAPPFAAPTVAVPLAATAAPPFAAPPAGARRAATAAPPVAARPSAAPSTQTAPWESYRVLTERNMFVRNRARRSGSGFGQGRETPSFTPRPSSGDENLVLTGIIHQGEDYYAFFENTRTGKTTTAQVGATLGKGRLTAVTLDAVHYAYDGNTTKITVGSNLAGLAASVPKPATVTGAPGAPAAASAALGTATAATAPATSTSPGVAAAPTLPTAPAVPTEAGTPTVATTATAPSPTTPPQAAAGTSAGTKDGGALGVLEQMRRRREQELNK